MISGAFYNKEDFFSSDIFHGIYIEKQKKSPSIFYNKEYNLLVTLKLDYVGSKLVDKTVYILVSQSAYEYVGLTVANC